MRVRTDGGVVVLKFYDYSSDHCKLLQEMQRLVPNQTVELMDGRHVRIYNLRLNFFELRDLNPIEGG
jgi:hypothetical protein